MGYSKLDYYQYIENESFWKSKGVALPSWTQDVYEHGGDPVCAIDFYDDIFGEDLETSRLPEDYQTGEYAGIAIEKDMETGKAQRHTFTKGNMELYDLIDQSEKFCLTAPVSYAGKRRMDKNARFLYSMTIEVDDIHPENGIDELFYSWERRVSTLPKPTYIVCSGNGLHMYFVFERPIPLYQNIFEMLGQVKQYFIPRYWNRYVTTMKDEKDIQYEPLCQPFRCVGTRTKKNSYAMAFKVGDKISIEYLNKFLPEDIKMDVIYKSNLSLEKAKELYPEWYKRRIEDGIKEKGHWDRHRGIYDNWKEKMLSGAEVGHRYHCLENLCSLAVQCNISPEEVERDCRELAVHLDDLTVSEDNHFTEYDIICALKTYQQPTDNAYRRKIEYISKKTGIYLTPNKRNGRKQKTHLKIARATLDIMNEEKNTNLQGRPKGSGTAEHIVSEWQQSHPDGKKVDCIRETGLSKPTVYKWWNR